MMEIFNFLGDDLSLRSTTKPSYPITTCQGPLVTFCCTYIEGQVVVKEILGLIALLGSQKVTAKNILDSRCKTAFPLPCLFPHFITQQDVLEISFPCLKAF